MGGNSGILSNLCLPAIVGICSWHYDSRLFHMTGLSIANKFLPLIVQDLVDAHPKVFRGTLPQISSTVPNGWRGLLGEFCLLLETICDERQLFALQFHSILDDSGCLILDFTFDCEVTAAQVKTLDARVFALRKRSAFTCCVCGRLTDTLTRPVVCTEHEKLA